MATPTCPKGQMYDKKMEKCVKAKNHKVVKVPPVRMEEQEQQPEQERPMRRKKKGKSK